MQVLICFRKKRKSIHEINPIPYSISSPPSPCNQPFSCHIRHEIPSWTQSFCRHFFLPNIKHDSRCLLPSPDMRNSTQIAHHCLLPYMGGLFHAAIQKKVLQQYHCLSVVIYRGIIWVYCIPHTSLAWLHLCSLGVTTVTRQWAIPQQSHAISSRDKDLYVLKKHLHPLYTQPKAWS